MVWLLLTVMFAGTLIFDPVLKICNWPDSTTCISDLLGPPSNRRVKLPGFVAANTAADLRTLRTTEVPVIVKTVKTTPANKLSKRILSLFQTKNRRPSRFRTGSGASAERNSNSDNSNNRRRLSSFKSKKDRNTFRDASQDITTSTTSTSTSTTTTRRTTTSSPTKRVTQRVAPRIRPFKLSATTRTPFRSRLRLKNPVKTIVEEEEEDEDDLEVTEVRKESSITSITSSVRVSVREESSLVADERPFSNGRGGDSSQ